MKTIVHESIEGWRGKIEKNGLFNPRVLRNSGFLVSLFQWREIYHRVILVVIVEGGLFQM